MKVLINPIITEKAMQDVGNSKYTFQVASDVNKHQIAQAIKEIYNVEAIKINIIKIKSQKKLVRGKTLATDRGYKKAIVTLKKGQKIEGFEVKE